MMSFFFAKAIKMVDISLRLDLENEEGERRRREKKNNKPTTFWRSWSSSLKRAASPATTS